MSLDRDGEPLECLEDHHGDCRGNIELRPSLSGTGTAIARCDHHWSKRLDAEEGHREFEYWGRNVMDPADAGERWDDD